MSNRITDAYYLLYILQCNEDIPLRHIEAFVFNNEASGYYGNIHKCIFFYVQLIKPFQWALVPLEQDLIQ